MGIFTSSFGSFFGSKKLGSEALKEKQLSAERIKKLVSSSTVVSLSKTEEALVEEAVISRRGGDGKISFRQIDELLRKLKHQGAISDTDRLGLTKVFENYFKDQL